MSERRVLFRPPAHPIPEQTPGRLQVIRGLLRADFSAFPAEAYRLGVFPARLRRQALYVPTSPAAVKKVLVEEQPNYPKSTVMQRILSPLIGTSMFVTNGEVWKRQRRMVDPTLELSRLKTFLPLMQGAVDDMVTRLDERVGAPVDIEVETMRVTADILCRTVFSSQVPAGFVDTLAEAFREYQLFAPTFLILEALGLPLWTLPHRRWKALRQAKRIRSLLEPLIHQRVVNDDPGARPVDLLTGLIEAQDPVTGARFSETDLLDEVVFFFLAGHETSASALSWSLYLLANDPYAQTKARDEVNTHIIPGAAEFSALRKLRFTRDVFREAMRLYPPVTSFIRDTVAPTRLGRRDVKAGDLVAVTPWFVHRSEKNWDHPEYFDPDRFQTAEGLASMRGAYLPFSQGPRVCSGAAFATQEALLILADVLARFRIDPVPGREPQPVAWLTQRSRNGIWVTFSRLADQA